MDSGRLPFCHLGSHSRIAIADLITYQRERATRRAALRTLTQLSDTLVRAAEVDLVQVVWGATILGELARTLRERLLRGHPAARARVGRLQAALTTAFPQGLAADDLRVRGGVLA